MAGTSASPSTGSLAEHPKPTRASGDRNLLFAILALQLDFVGREPLIAAMNAWAVEKTKPLGNILVERGNITPDRRKMLDGLVDEHLKQHGGDPGKSLASLGPTEASQDIVKTILDRDVASQICHAASMPCPADPPATEPMNLRGAPSGNNRFRLVRFHAKGGLGKVWVANDEELDREVALKEIQEDHATNQESVARFIFEAKVTGGLEHPGIVPVYGLGEHSDGLPFYVMRFIRGEDLREAITRYHRVGGARDVGQRRLALQRLLRRFVDVCNAMEYAHSRRVLHRDLKPENIILGKYGETLLVDWGLAKPMDELEADGLPEESSVGPLTHTPSTQTRMGAVMGTPAYMSPEQAAGENRRVGPASDVYSLGATLYTLLTGKEPFVEKEVYRILQRVRQGDFVRPRAENREVPAALEAICLKAMALSPKDRYSSPAALAEDIEHWLADEPVRAWQEPLVSRLWRWTRKHRTLVTSTVAAVFVAAVVLSFGVTILSSMERQQRILKEQAITERERAEDNLRLAREAVDQMLTRVGDDALADVPQMEQVRGGLLEQAREFYRQFVRQKPTDPRLRMEAALAHHRVGDIDRVLGHDERARKSYQEAIHRLEELHQDFPGEPEYQAKLADCLNWLGILLRRDASRHIEAEEAFQRALSLQQTLVRNHPDRAAYRKELARTYYNRGIHFSTGGDTVPRAQRDYLEATRLLEGLLHDPGALSDTSEIRHELSRCYNNLGNLLKRDQDYEAAANRYRRAIELLSELHEESPDRREYRHELAAYHNNVANLLLRQGQLEEAKEHNRQAVTLFEELSRGIPGLRNELANAYNSCGVIWLHDDSPGEARDVYERAAKVFSDLHAEFPDNLHYRDRLGNALYNLAKVDYQLGNHDEAIRQAQRAVEHHEAARKSDPRNLEFRTHLRNDYLLLAAVHLLANNHAAAAESARRLPEIFPETWDEYWRAATLLAQCLPLVADDDGLDASEQRRAADAYAQTAVVMLEHAVDRGFRDVERFNEATAEGGPLAPLRDFDSFRSVSARLSKPESGR